MTHHRTNDSHSVGDEVLGKGQYDEGNIHRTAANVRLHKRIRGDASEKRRGNAHVSS